MLDDATANGAENASNYTVSEKTVTKAELSDDGKSVTLTLDSALVNNTAYTVTAKKNIETANGQELSTSDFVTSLFFVDTVKPTVSSVTTKADGSIEINFSEKIAAASSDDLDVYVNGQPVAHTAFTADTSKVAVSKANLADANLTAGNSYGVIVEGATDVANPANTMNLFSGSFTYNPVVDKTAPTWTSLTAKDEDTLSLTFSEELLSLSGAEVKVYKGQTELATAVNPDPADQTAKYTVDLTNVYAAGETTANLRVEVKAFRDTSGNFGVNKSQNITVNKDVVKPQLASSKYDVANEEFEIVFNELLTETLPEAAKFVITDANGVLYTAVPVSIEDKTVTLDVSGLEYPETGTFTVQVLADAVTDTSQAKNGNAAFSTTIAKTAAPSGDTVKPTVTLTPGTKGVITATFSEPVKAGNVAGSATLLSNYQLNGKALPTGTVITLAAGQTVATITLPVDSLSTTQANLVTASNVQDLAGNVLTSTTQVVTLTENTTPKLTAAAYQADGTLKFTFSENVIIDGTVATTDEDDFVVTVAGNELVPTNYSIAKGTEDNELVVTPAAGFSFATGTITVETAETTTIDDAADNTLKSGTVVNVGR